MILLRLPLFILNSVIHKIGANRLEEKRTHGSQHQSSPCNLGP